MARVARYLAAERGIRQFLDIAAYNARGIPMKARDKAGVERFFEGLTLLNPGVTLVHHWHPDGAPTFDDAHVDMYGGVAVNR
jgi:hypothetical protein